MPLPDMPPAPAVTAPPAIATPAPVQPPSVSTSASDLSVNNSTSIENNNKANAQANVTGVGIYNFAETSRWAVDGIQGSSTSINLYANVNGNSNNQHNYTAGFNISIPLGQKKIKRTALARAQVINDGMVLATCANIKKAELTEEQVMALNLPQYKTCATKVVMATKPVSATPAVAPQWIPPVVDDEVTQLRNQMKQMRAEMEMLRHKANPNPVPQRW